jgi:hypothetical protein
MVNRDFYWWLKGIAETKEFAACMPLSSRQMDEQYDMELALRFFVLKNTNEAGLKGIEDIGEFLTKRMLEFANDKSFNRESEQQEFEDTFKILGETLADDSFRRYDSNRDRFLGGFLISSYEVIAVGVGDNIAAWLKMNPLPRKDDIVKRIKSVWSNQQFQDYSGSGVRASSRIPVIVPLGKNLFRP